MTEPERIRRMLLDVLDDCKQTQPEQMRVQLLAAGWRPVSQSIWKHPNGSLYLGPYGAWKKMCAEIKSEPSSAAEKNRGWYEENDPQTLTDTINAANCCNPGQAELLKKEQDRTTEGQAQCQNRRTPRRTPSR
jgi:hypothetical protein